VNSEAGRAVPGDNDAAAVEFVYEFFANKEICVAASPDGGGKYASAINAFKSIKVNAVWIQQSLLEVITMSTFRINMSHILEYVI